MDRIEVIGDHASLAGGNVQDGRLAHNLTRSLDTATQNERFRRLFDFARIIVAFILFVFVVNPISSRRLKILFLPLYSLRDLKQERGKDSPHLPDRRSCRGE